MDAADELFSLKGFDGTSTNDILAKVGIARGTLYYHFKSKEDIMDALIERNGVHLLGAARKIAADPSIPVCERIILTVMALKMKGGSSEEMMEHIHKPQNALMHQKIEKFIVDGVTPILTNIIREGIEQGLFNTPYPYECVEMIMIYANTAFDDGAERTEEEQATKLQAFIFHVERMLGAESGSLMDVIQIFGGNPNTPEQR